MSTLNVRVNKKTKEAAGKVLADIGLDLSSGVKVFLQQVITENGLPFRPTKNLNKLRKEIDAEVEDALENGTRYSNTEELLSNLD